MSAPQEVRDALASRYGVTGGALVGYFLDPDKGHADPGEAVGCRPGHGCRPQQQVAIDKATSERLAAQGVSYDQAEQGFGQVAATTWSPPGRVGGPLTTSDLIGAAFGDAAAQQKVTRIAKGRTGKFQEGGGAATAAGA